MILLTISPNSSMISKTIVPNKTSQALYTPLSSSHSQMPPALPLLPITSTMMMLMILLEGHHRAQMLIHLRCKREGTRWRNRRYLTRQ